VSVPPAGAILAGGQARRFGGGAKGLELLGGARIVDRVLAALREVASDVVLVGAGPGIAATLPSLRLVPDEAPGAGPLGGIIAALRATGRDTVVVAWDMPFIEAKHLRPLLESGSDAEAVAWEVDGRVEPLCTLYRAGAVGQLVAAFAAGERSQREALRRLRVHLVRRAASEDPSPFTSVNTPEQLAAARRAWPAVSR
jgi:molybdopterin-guanine dinucleotide biosynthesis protein A